MAKYEFIPKKFKPESLAVIEAANEILEKYAEGGYDLTLRQLYYQFVARGYFENENSNYKRLGSIINDARLAGLVDWDHIVDRTRGVMHRTSWETPEDILKSAANTYHLDYWADQKIRPEVWIEKDALSGVIHNVCHTFDVPYFVCRGYSSQSAMFEAAKRMIEYRIADQVPVILHLGDHDPSGVDMSRDIFDRLQLLAGGVEVIRIALTMEQIEELNPPPNPAKFNDPRARDYIYEHGHESWELDALEPEYMENLIAGHLNEYRDEKKWKAVERKEKAGRKLLEKNHDRWDDVKKLIKGKKK